MMNGATPERFGVDAEGEVGHGGVARQRDLVHLAALDAAFVAHLAGELVQRLVGEAAEPVQGGVGSIIVALIRVITSAP